MSFVFIGFFNTGAYQETIGGYGGLQHCLIPAPKHVLIHKDANGIIRTERFRGQQRSEDFLKILGYTEKHEECDTHKTTINSELLID